jgi:carboxylate-amine ligase
MPNLIFHESAPLTMGAELELQLIDPVNKQMVSRAKDLIRNIADSKFKSKIKPEITQGMIELNSGIHTTPQALHKDLLKLSHFLEKQSKRLDIQICSGGSHPVERWNQGKIFPIPRFKNHSWLYRYLSKNFTIFALHLHLGCKSAEDALYLTHLLSRYVPQFIALSASSPYYQGIDTGFNSSRLNMMKSFPTSGHIPFVTDWQQFSAYYFKLKKLKIIHSMKDIYWDIRPKPTFGTVEIRIFDAPLTLQHAAVLVAYAQTLAHFLLTKPYPVIEDLYTVYNYNRFQACRFGFDGRFIHPQTLKSASIQDDILDTLQLLKPHARALNTSRYLKTIERWAEQKRNDAQWLRKQFAKTESFEKLVQQQCKIWDKQF